MNPLAKSQIDLNRQTVADWTTFATHRKRVTGLLSGGSPGKSERRLCVLGAGNCNDLELGSLLRSYSQIHLVDLDAAALVGGIARQGLANEPALRPYGNVDLTGQLDEMAGWSSRTAIEAADLEACRILPSRRIDSVVPGRYDLVASTCLLSQLISFVVDTVGVEHPSFHKLLGAIRVGHLRLLMHLVVPGGTGVLITDIVSSDTAPSLASVPEGALSSVLARLIEAGNLFYGVGPAMLASACQTDPILATQSSEVVYSHPWLWHLGPRVYAVYAMKVSKPLAS